ncbi:hypothetical protein [Candidatus Nanohalobium constans]|uniref:Uncharacterized protein n=1 Tax=Candidatus Nanohalobium constans TaxID=2565781 RepID=A0A5Q0UH02_9ARCH|nr:hypothetical protein [Candidatus Nanohalobium constans]QGA80932.1 hypothetical protein LC1Nh_1060 [Candidatus Nanohalobium constans]
MSDVDSVSGDTAKLLKDVTGESRVDSAVRSTVRDAMIYRLGKVEDQIEGFEEKYGMSFEEFEDEWEDNNIDDKHSHEVEKDFWEWEGLVSRKKVIEDALEDLE